MNGFDDIRRGLAANLAVLRDDGFQVNPYLLEKPTTPSLAIAGIRDIDYDIAFRSGDYEMVGDRMIVVVEAVLGKAVDVAAQRNLDKLHGAHTVDNASGLKNALEADTRLTSRLLDSGQVLPDQPPACDALRVIKFRGQSPFMLTGGVEVLLATWDVEVVT